MPINSTGIQLPVFNEMPPELVGELRLSYRAQANPSDVSETDIEIVQEFAGADRPIGYCLAGQISLDIASRDGLPITERTEWFEYAKKMWLMGILDEVELEEETLASLQCETGIAFLPTYDAILLNHTLPELSDLQAQYWQLCSIAARMIQHKKAWYTVGGHVTSPEDDIDGQSAELATLLLQLRPSLRSDGPQITSIAAPSLLMENLGTRSLGEGTSNAWDTSRFVRIIQDGRPVLVNKLQVKKGWRPEPNYYEDDITVVVVDRDLKLQDEHGARLDESVTERIIKDCGIELESSDAGRESERLNARYNKLRKLIAATAQQQASAQTT